MHHLLHQTGDRRDLLAGLPEMTSLSPGFQGIDLLVCLILHRETCEKGPLLKTEIIPIMKDRIEIKEMTNAVMTDTGTNLTEVKTWIGIVIEVGDLQEAQLTADP